MKRGFEVVRRLDDDERRLLTEAFAAAPRGAAPRAIHWANLYLNGAFTADHPLRDRLHDWVGRAVAGAYADWPEVHVLTYGFLVNPAGNPDAQPFHVDYTRTSSNLFVPLTRVTLRNAPQYVRRSPAHGPFNAHGDFGSLDDLMEREGWDAVEVSQLVCRPFVLLRLLPDTPHRGIANGEDHDRVMFFVTVDAHRHALPEAPFYKYSEREYEPA